MYNASVTFQIFINDVLKKYLNVFYTIYFDNILIYNNIKKKYVYHVDKMLKKFQQIDLYFDINKCEFHIIRIKYFDLIIITNKIKIDLKKIEIIV